MRNKVIIVISIIIILIGGYIFYRILNENNKFEKISIIEEADEEQKIDDNSEIEINNDIENSKNIESDEEKILVHITGEVVQRGVVYLEKESRIIDAINAAGGTTEKADLSKVNLAYILEDGMKVTIPSIEEINISSNKNEYIESTISDNIVENGNNNSSKSDFKKSAIVNINTATQTELETLPGIGPSTALKIINYRKENGKFNNIEDIKNVSGIGDSKYEKIKNYISV